MQLGEYRQYYERFTSGEISNDVIDLLDSTIYPSGHLNLVFDIWYEVVKME